MYTISAYTIFNQLLELLLVVDMVVNVLRSFYNEQGVLIYSTRAIRVKYFSSYFLIDLVCAIPFQILVQVCSSSAHCIDQAYSESQHRLYICVCTPIMNEKC